MTVATGERRAVRPRAGSLRSILEADPGLFVDASEQDRDELRDLIVPVRALAPGGAAPTVRADDQDLAMLILDGAMSLRTGVFDAVGDEILGPGDQLLPAEEAEPGILPYEPSCKILAPARVAILEAGARARMHRVPGLAEEVMRRVRESARTQRRLAAVANITNAGERLLLVLWELAARWGTPYEGAALIELPLTQRTLGSIAHCARETVGKMLPRLRANGLVSWPEGRFVLHGLPPADLAALRGTAAEVGLDFEPKL